MERRSKTDSACPAPERIRRSLLLLIHGAAVLLAARAAMAEEAHVPPPPARRSALRTGKTRSAASAKRAAARAFRRRELLDPDAARKRPFDEEPGSLRNLMYAGMSSVLCLRTIANSARLSRSPPHCLVAGSCMRLAGVAAKAKAKEAATKAIAAHGRMSNGMSNRWNRI